MSDDLVANTSLKSPDLGLIGDHRGLSKLRQLGRGGKKEQALDKSINFQNISVEEEFINRDVFTNLGKDSGIEPIIEKIDDDVNESFYHDKYFIDKFPLLQNKSLHFLYFVEDSDYYHYYYLEVGFALD